MLTEVVHLPTAYFIDQSLPAELQANVRALILIDSLRNDCVLLVDSEQNMLKKIAEAVFTWPQKYRDHAMRSLIQLDKAKRIVPMHPVPLSYGAWHAPYCLQAVALARQEQPDGVIAASKCTCAQACSPMAAQSGVTLVSIDEYSVSAFARTVSDRAVFERAKGVYAEKELDAEVWRRIFRHTKRARVYDRYLGRTFVQEFSHCPLEVVRRYVEERQQGNPANINVPQGGAQKYYEGVNRICEAFARHSVRGGELIFHSDLRHPSGNYIDPLFITAAAIRLHDMASDFTRRFPGANGACNVEMCLIDSTNGGSEAEHDRYVVTDQLCLKIGKGIPLLNNRGVSTSISITKGRDGSIPYKPFRDPAKLLTRERVGLKP